MRKFGIIAIFFLLLVKPVVAAPDLYFDEGATTVVDYTHSVGLFINTNGSTITAFQTTINLPTSVIGYESLLVSDYPSPEFTNGTKPNCVHTLLPPEWGFANKASPYEFEDKLYISCGFINPGYTTAGSAGDKLATLTFYADTAGTGSLSFVDGTTKYYFNGNTVATGTTSTYSITVASAIEATPGPGVIPERATDSISEGDLNFVEVSGGGTRTSTSTTTQTVSQGTGTDGDLEVVEEDNEIPPPPDDLPKRSLPESLLDRLRSRGSSASESGQVLSAQSLRELLIPGTSDADKRVVWINLVSLILFLVIVSFMIWRIIKVKRQSKLKSDHLSEMLAGELAAIESKMGGPIRNQELNRELSNTIEQIKNKYKDKE